MISRLSLFCLFSFFLSSVVQATNYREDSFEYFGDIPSGGIVGIPNPLHNLKVKEKKRLVLINGEVITPIEYSDGSSFAFDETQTNNFSSWNEVDMGVNQYNSTSELTIKIGDFNGDGYSDQLLVGNILVSQVIVVYGSNHDLPSKVGVLELDTPEFTLINGSSADITIEDLNGDGIDDILFTYKEGSNHGDKYQHLVSYGSSSGASSLGWQHPDSPQYAVDNLPAVKPNHGSLVPGGSNGMFRVSESGSAAFNLPLHSPKGPANMNMNLSLNYDSQGGNGPLGKGWSMSAGEVITLCPATRYQNASTQQVQYCLNGKRLVLLSGGGTEDRIFATEISDISKIAGTFSANSDYATNFEIFKKDGTKHTFTKISENAWTTDKVHNPTGTAYVHYEYLENGSGTYKKNPSMLSKVSIKTTSGETIASTHYTYETRPDFKNIYADGALKYLNKRLSQVTVKNAGQTVRNYYLSYGRSELTGFSRLTYIQECGLNNQCFEPLKFDWTDKTVLDSFVQTRTGGDSNVQPLVGDFNGDGFGDVVTRNGNKVRTFLGNQNGQFHLTSAPLGHVWSYLNGVDSESNVIALDFNRDGITDLVSLDVKKTGTGNCVDKACFIITPYLGSDASSLTKPENQLNINGELGYFYLQTVYFTKQDPIVIEDLAGLALEPGQYFGLGIGIDTLTSAATKKDSPTYMYTLQDINGDAIPDVVRTYQNMPLFSPANDTLHSIRYSLGEIVDGKVTFPTVSSGNDFNLNTYIRTTLTTSQNCDSAGSKEFRTSDKFNLTDIDNDGFIDYLITGSKGCYGVSESFDSSKWYVVFSNLGRNAGKYSEIGIAATEKILLADFNGDGFIDIHTKTSLRLNKGNGTFQNASPELVFEDGDEINNYIPLELSSDGLTDFIKTDYKTIEMAFNESGDINFYNSSFQPQRSSGSDWIYAPQNIDVNADGIPDIVTVSKGGNITTFLQGIASASNLSNGPDLIKTITSSNGLKTNIEYGVASQDPSLYQKDNDAQQPNNTWSLNAPLFDVTGSVHLVKRVVEDSPSTANQNTTVSKRYAYVGGKLQAGGRGFLGFRQLIEVDETQDVYNVTEYAQQFPYTGMPLYTYKVKPGVDIDDEGITGFIASNAYQPVTNLVQTSGFEPLSNLDANGELTIDDGSECRSLMPSVPVAGNPEDMAWISCSRNILNVKEFATADSSKHNYNPVFPYVEVAIEEEFHNKTYFDGAPIFERRADANGNSLVKTTISRSEYAGNIDSFYGELTSQRTQVTVYSGRSLVSHITGSSFKYDQNDVANWHLGRMTEQLVTKTVSIGYERMSYPGTMHYLVSGDSSGSSGTPRTYTVSSSFAGLEDHDLSYLSEFLDDSVEPVTRKTTYGYNAQGLLASTITEPDDPNLTVITEYDYDAWGNRTKVTKRSHASADSDLQFWRQKETVYDVNGVYPVTTYEYPNGAGSRRLLSQVQSRNALGLVEDQIGQNNVSVSTDYDGFGRKISESSSIGALKTTSYDFCGSDIHAPTGCYLLTETWSNNAPAQKTFTDKLGQTIRKSKVGFDGNWIHVDAVYDKLGNALAQSNPHSDTASYWTTTDYDIFGRPVRVVEPNGATQGKEYDGLYTTTIDANGLSKATLVNLDGKPIFIKEFKSASGSETLFKEMYFKYDHQGNQTQVIGDGMTVLTQYNKIGQAINSNDEAKGTWYYRNNALGELVAQLNAKGDYTRNTYDDLGRNVSRTISVLQSGDIDSPVLGAQLEHTSWVYDAAANGIGKLESVSGNFNYLGMNTSYSDVFTYNNDAQPEFKISTIDGISYKESWVYDSVGRVEIHYDASNGLSGTPTNGTKTHFNGNNYVSGLSNVSETEFYFTPLESDSWGNITRYQFGNGVVTKAIYDSITGRMSHLHSGKNSANDEIIDLFYAYDAMGNLDYKTDSQLGYTEDITYDDTYRITSVNASGVFTNTSAVDEYSLTMSYYSDPSGRHMSNIKTKSNYESGAQYNYGATGQCAGQQCGPSVLTSVGNMTFEYDANGNRIFEKRLGVTEREAEFTSYDKPWRIQKGNNTSSFAYGASNNRIKQVSMSNGKQQTLHYIGNVEMQLKDGAWYYKRRIAGYAIEEEKLNTDTSLKEIELSYLHVDYQGSVVAITNDAGAIQQRLSYDVYGKRRDVLYNHATGYIKPTSSLYDLIGVHTYNEELTELVRQTALDQRGYTGHEHLDGVELIHMNGRVFDAASGLFISADPNLPDVSNQYYMNRYSYGFNNPVTYTDPSGYFNLGFISDAIDDLANSKTFWAIAVTVVTGGAGVGWAIAGGFISGYIATGTFEGAAMGALFAGVSYGIGSLGADMASQIGGTAGQIAAGVTKVMLHGFVGGIRASMAGQSFKSGFRSAGLASAVGSAGGYASAGIETSAGRIAASAVLGGVTSELSGGSFANGAITAAFVQAYNDENHPGRGCGGRPCKKSISEGENGVYAIGIEGTVVEGVFGVKGAVGLMYDSETGKYYYYTTQTSEYGLAISGVDDKLVAGVEFQGALTIEKAPSLDFFKGEGVQNGYSLGIFGLDQTTVPGKGAYWGIDIGLGLGASVSKTKTEIWEL